MAETSSPQTPLLYWNAAIQEVSSATYERRKKYVSAFSDAALRGDSSELLGLVAAVPTPSFRTTAAPIDLEFEVTASRFGPRDGLLRNASAGELRAGFDAVMAARAQLHAIQPIDRTDASRIRADGARLAQEGEEEYRAIIAAATDRAQRYLQFASPDRGGVLARTILRGLRRNKSTAHAYPELERRGISTPDDPELARAEVGAAVEHLAARLANGPLFQPDRDGHDDAVRDAAALAVLARYQLIDHHEVARAAVGFGDHQRGYMQFHAAVILDRMADEHNRTRDQLVTGYEEALDRLATGIWVSGGRAGDAQGIAGARALLGERPEKGDPLRERWDRGLQLLLGMRRAGLIPDLESELDPARPDFEAVRDLISLARYETAFLRDGRTPTSPLHEQLVALASQEGRTRSTQAVGR